MSRIPDLRFGAVVLLLITIIVAGALPNPSTDVMRPIRPAGDEVRGPAPGSWVTQLSSRIERAPRPDLTPETQQDPFGRYELIGLVETGDAQWALIAGEGRSVTLQLGDALNGYELVQILADRVVFSQDGDQRVLELNR